MKKKVTAFLSVLFLILLVFSYQPITHEIDQFFLMMRNNLISNIEKTIGRNFSFSRISPSLFQGLDIYNFKIFNPNGKIILETNRMMLKFNLLNLFNEDFIISEIILQDANIALDSKEDNEVIKLLFDILSREGGIPKLSVIGEKINLTLNVENNVFNFSDLNFRFDNLIDRYNFTLIGELNGNLTTETPLRTFNSKIQSWGRFDPEFQDAVLEISIQDFSSNIFDIKNQNLRLSKIGSSYTLRTIQNAQPFDLEVTFAPDRAYSSLRLVADRLRISNFLKIKQLPSEFGVIFYSSFTGKYFFEQQDNKLNFNVDGNIQTPDIPRIGRILVSMNASGDETTIRAKNISLQGSNFDLNYQGKINLAKQLGLSGKLTILKWMSPFQRQYAGSIDFAQTNNDIKVSGNFYEEASQESVNIIGKLLLENDVYSLDLKSDGIVTSDLRFVYFPKTEVVSGNLFIKNYHWKSAFHHLSIDNLFWVQWLTNWSIETEISWIISPSRKFISISYLKSFDEAVSTRALELSGQFTDDNFNLNVSKFNFDDYKINAFFNGKSSNNEVELSYGIKINNYSYEGILNANFQDNFYQIGDSTKTYFTLKQQETTFFINWNFEKLKIPINEISFLLTTQGQLNYNFQSGDFEQLFAHLSLERSSFLNMQDLILDISLSSDGKKTIFLESVALTDNFSKIEGSGTLNFSTFNSPSLDLSLFSADGTKSVIVDTKIYDNNWDVNLIAQGIEIERFLKDSLFGEFNLQVRANLKDNKWAGEALLYLPKAKFGNDSFSAASKITLTDDKILIRETYVQHPNFLINNVDLKIDLNSGKLDGSGDGQGRFNGVPWSSRFELDINTEERIDFDRNFLGLERIIGNFSLKDFYIDNKLQNNFSLRFSKIGSITTFRAGEGNFILGRITDDGEFRIILNEPFPVRASFEGVFKNGIIEASLQNLTTSADLINLVLSPSILKILRGTISSSISIRGFITDPIILEGEVIFSEIYAQTSSVKGIIGPLNSHVKFEDSRFVIQETEVPFGSGRLKIQGEFFPSRWILDRYFIKLFVEETHPLGLNLTFSQISLDGFVSGNLDLSGSLLGMDVSGDIEISNMVILLLNEEQENTSSNNFPINIDLTIQSGNRVSFVWPLVQFPIIRAYISPKQHVSFLNKGLLGTFKLSGEVFFRGGEIFYLNQVFYLKEGEIKLNEDQYRFDPFISLTGELRTRDSNGSVIIYLLVNDFLSKFSPRFTSNPSKTTDEINALVGNILIPGRYTQVGWRGALNLASDVGSSFILRPFEEAIRTTFFLDMFSIRTQIINQFVIGQINNQQPSLQDYLDNTSIFWGKYISENIFLEGLFSLTTSGNLNEPNFNQDLIPRLELGLEMQTPIFLINWRFVPQNPSELFIPDNTIDLSWRWKF